MEASAVATPEPPAVHDGRAEATRSMHELFQWSGYVHVGAGADDCEHGVDGHCTNTAHFHAWICLPNQFQIRDIADKARAAQARKRRALRDSESDSYAVLENELDALREPVTFDALVKAITARHVERDLLGVVEDMSKDERFEHHAQDSEEYRRMAALPEGERDAEEWERLQADMLAYGEELQQLIDRRSDAEEAKLRALSQDEVIELERKWRIEDAGNEVYLHTYYTWVMYTCTMEPTTDGFPSQRKFKTPEALKLAAPEVVPALREKIRTFEQRMSAERGDAAGN